MSSLKPLLRSKSKCTAEVDPSKRITSAEACELEVFKALGGFVYRVQAARHGSLLAVSFDTCSRSLCFSVCVCVAESCSRVRVESVAGLARSLNHKHRNPQTS